MNPVTVIPRQFNVILGVALATTIGHLGLPALPFTVAAITDGMHLSAARAGFYATAELVPYALVQLLLAPYAPRLSPRQTALCGCVLIVLGSLVSASAFDTTVFGCSRVMVGAGFGIVFGVANSAGALASVPERAYAIGMTTSTLFYVALLPLLGNATEIVGRLAQHAFSPPFLLIAVFVGALTPTMVFLPTKSRQSSILSEKRTFPLLRIPSLRSVAALSLMALFSVSVFSVYAFVARRGQELSMTTAAIGNMLSVTFIVGMVGSAIAALMGRRFGTRIPLTMGFLIQGATCFGIAVARSSMELWLFTALDLALWSFLYPYLFGISTAIDVSGKLAIRVGAVYLVGSSVASALAGLLLNWGTFFSVGVLALILCLIGSFVAFVLVTGIERDAMKGGGGVK